jgi:ribosomal protein S18 acetylase RimI-like enzyme
MFYEIKHKLDNPVVRKLIGESAFDNSSDAIDKKVAEFLRKKDWHLYGWIENNEILGVCGFEVYSDYVEISNIAVSPDARKHGTGKAMIFELQQKYKMKVEAETDDDAVGFYLKCGFKAKAFIKTYSHVECRRYKCVLPFYPVS